MKIAYLPASIASLAISFVGADCDCDPSDIGCLNDCVGNTSRCISECNSNDCYNSCISNHWPGMDRSDSDDEIEASNTWNSWQSTPTVSWANGESSTWPTTPAYAPSSASDWRHSSVWSQSSGWPSTSTWGPNSSGYSGVVPPAASASGVSSGSSATYQMSKVVVGLSLAAAAYLLQ